MFSPKRGFQRGSAPLPPEAFFPLLLLNVYATVACRRRLQKAPRRIHERLPRTYSRPAQGLDKDPKLVWDMLEAGNAKAAPGPRGIWMRSRKAELYLLEKAGRCLRRPGGLSPRPRPGNTMTRLLAREAARQQASLFSPSGFQRAQPLPPEAFFLFAS